MDTPRFRVAGISSFSRTIPYRLPFHVAGKTIDQGRQVLARADIVLENGASASGWAAECPAPIWFDKSRAESDTAAAIAAMLRRAAGCYQDEPRPLTAFQRFQEVYPVLQGEAAASHTPAVIASFGQALIDHAILDALCRACGVSFFTAMQANLPGMTVDLCSDLRGFDLAGWLAARVPKTSLEIRHTIGLSDPLTERPEGGPNDGLPVTLQEVVGRYGVRSFKVKIDADLERSLKRLRDLAAFFDGIGSDWTVTLDGNEGYRTAEAVQELTAAITADPRLAMLRQRILYIEQPIHRDCWREQAVGAVGLPVIVDEADGTLDDFPAALSLGYAGISAKTCKGVYKAVLNAARCVVHRGAFVSGEDLNHPAGLSMNQDLAVAALLGLERVERNGHHVIDGIVEGTSAQADYCRRHPGLYAVDGGSRPRLVIRQGQVDLTSLAQPGFGAGCAPSLSDPSL